jgi:hypothetical protein
LMSTTNQTPAMPLASPAGSGSHSTADAINQHLILSRGRILRRLPFARTIHAELDCGWTAAGLRLFTGRSSSL